MDVPSWRQLWRRARAVWRNRRTRFSICPECTFPFLVTAKLYDTAGPVPCLVRTDGTYLCGDCSTLERELVKQNEVENVTRLLTRRDGDVLMIPDGGYEARWVDAHLEQYPLSAVSATSARFDQDRADEALTSAVEVLESQRETPARRAHLVIRSRRGLPPS